MNNLPEGVSAIIVFKGPFIHGVQRTTIMNKSETIIKAANMLGDSNRDFRIFPISSETTYCRMPHLKTAWNEGMTLNEFEDYLND